MRLRVGTSGFSYKEWKGPFYPEQLKNDAMLPFYAERLPAVEINNTFYRMPAKSVLAKWRQQVPDGFRFVLKASRRITHQLRLADAQEPLAYVLEGAAVLGEQLGALLFQLPPYLRKDADRLRAFLGLLADGPRVAFEFRHASWFDDEIFGILSDGNAALCLADGDNEERNPPWRPTADWGYLRLRRDSYSDHDLESWIEKIGDTGWSDSFVFFKHEDAGAGPRLAARMAALAGPPGPSTR